MGRFDKIKTVHMVLALVLTGIAMYIVFTDAELYRMIATNAHVRLLCILLWIAMELSLLFMYFDFTLYANLLKENRELDLAVTSDPLTGIANRYSCDAYIAQFIGKPLPEDMGCVTLDMTSLREINARYGHDKGDETIQKFSAILLDSADGECFIGRNGGNKFLAIFRDCTERKLQEFLNDVKLRVQVHNESSDGGEIRYVYGEAFEEGEEVTTVTGLIALSDRRAFEKEMI